MIVVLVGEMNPYGVDPRYALFDLPVNSAGWRLRTHILRVERRTYFGFQRHNLCFGPKWSKREAEREAARLYLDVYDSRRVEATFVLLGKKVATAFGWGHHDPFMRDERVILLPHPSGRCRVWNDEKSYARAIQLLQEGVPGVPWGEVPTAATSSCRAHGTRPLSGPPRLP